jgi:hypothetical protein
VATSIFLLLIGSEVVQLFFPKQFMFDVYDLAAAITAFFLSFYFIIKRNYEKISQMDSIK